MVKTISNPLDPNVLRAAGVPLEDALWIARVPEHRRVAVLANHRRSLGLLAKLRSHFGVVSGTSQPFAA